MNLQRRQELDKIILTVKTLDKAQSVAIALLKEITQNVERDEQTQIWERSLMAALILNNGRFCVNNESPLRRMRGMLNTNIDYLERAFSLDPEESLAFSESKKAPDLLNLMDSLNDRLKSLVPEAVRGHRV